METAVRLIIGPQKVNATIDNSYSANVLINMASSVQPYAIFKSLCRSDLWINARCDGQPNLTQRIHFLRLFFSAALFLNTFDNNNKRPKQEFQQATTHGAVVSLFLGAAVVLLAWRELVFSMKVETVEKLFVNSTISSTMNAT